LVEVDPENARVLYDTLNEGANFYVHMLITALGRALDLVRYEEPDDDAPDAASAEPTTADDGLDIPSFLRRQTAA
jgi:hypothetical protein